MKHTSTRTVIDLGMIAGLALAGAPIQAQVLFNEQFTGGASTTGFTVSRDGGDCDWAYAPGDLVPNDFSRDGTGVLPSGAGFDTDFGYVDSDACTGSGGTVNAFLTSAPFDASQSGSYILSFTHQFHGLNASFGKVEVYNGSTWDQVALYTGQNVGYPNPSATASWNITSATGGSAVAQVRFQFKSNWDYWWALDNIQVERTDCAFPNGLSTMAMSTTSAMIMWTDNGSAGYEWVVTTGAEPDGTNAVASGDGANTTASGLMANTAYAVFIRATCTGGGNSAWSSGAPFSTMPNDVCAGAIPLTVNAEGSCAQMTHGTVMGATPSGMATTCSGGPNDDVWFSFVASGTSQEISLINITGSTSDLYHAVWSGSCGALTLVAGSCSDPQESTPEGLVAGATYYLQVYTFPVDPGQDSQFDVCIAGTSVGITEHSADQALRVFPNPTTDRLFVTYDGRDAVNVTVVDLAGKPVLERPMAKSIAVDALADGAYLLMVFDAQGHPLARRPFVKN